MANRSSFGRDRYKRWSHRHFLSNRKILSFLKWGHIKCSIHKSSLLSYWWQTSGWQVPRNVTKQNYATWACGLAVVTNGEGKKYFILSNHSKYLLSSSPPIFTLTHLTVSCLRSGLFFPKLSSIDNNPLINFLKPRKNKPTVAVSRQARDRRLHVQRSGGIGDLLPPGYRVLRYRPGLLAARKQGQPELFVVAQTLSPLVDRFLRKPRSKSRPRLVGSRQEVPEWRQSGWMASGRNWWFAPGRQGQGLDRVRWRKIDHDRHRQEARRERSNNNFVGFDPSNP